MPVQALGRLVSRLATPVPSAVEKGLDLVAAGDALGDSYAVLRQMFSPRQAAMLGAPAMRAGGYVIGASGLSSCDGRASVGVMSTLEIRNYLSNTLLRDTDVMSMASALEVRAPLVDHKVVELVVALPDHLKLRRGSNKALLAGIVPDIPRQAVSRRKVGFTLPFAAWFRGPMRRWVEERLFEGACARQELLQRSEVRRLWSEFLRGEKWVSHSRIWCLAVLGDWCERHGAEATWDTTTRVA
jgi:asparagine synthase (glutamine-hydrolysing)